MYPISFPLAGKKRGTPKERTLYFKIASLLWWRRLTAERQQLRMIDLPGCTTERSSGNDAETLQSNARARPLCQSLRRGR